MSTNVESPKVNMEVNICAFVAFSNAKNRLKSPKKRQKCLFLGAKKTPKAIDTGVGSY